uniref:hypothetical protein n=1 Tax=Trichocoleus desertorum TaxID=1481672 RepID=UPI0025B36137|nr:hypothetical protein [Trichocoleus desertorum]
MNEPQQLTPQEQTADLAIAIINQHQAFAEEVADKVIADAQTVPERAVGLILRKAEQQGALNTLLFRWRIGEPIEVKENLLLDILWATTWVGWVVRAALYALLVVVVAGIVQAWFLPPVQDTQYQATQETKN